MPRDYTMTQENQAAVELYRQGKRIKEISLIQDRNYSAVVAAIHRARTNDPKLDPKNRERRTLEADVKRFGVKVGPLIDTIQENASVQVRQWICEQTKKNDYRSIAEYLVDLAIDAYFEETKDDQ